jgi:exopolysaccharide production protein ExoF
MRRGTAMCTLVLLLGTLWVGTSSCAYADYKLGPRDKVRVKVSEWRQATGQIYEWTALNGEFAVGQDGTIALPLVGTLHADSKTSAELADLISDRLRTAIGLANRPATAVEIITYRPIYIVGEVDKPGEYEFRPEMTVLEAISVAGGLYRAPELRRLGRETIASEGDLRVLWTTWLAQLGRQARLQAEVADSEDISFPSELLSRKNNSAVAEIMTHETSLFLSRRKTLQSKLESFSRTISLLEQEIDVLQSKKVTVERQFALATQERNNINKLIEQKLAVSSRQLALEQVVAQYESTRLDLGLAIVRAHQEISKAQRDASDAVNIRNNDVLTELGKIDEQLASIGEKRATFERLVDETRFAGDLQQRRLTLTVTRKKGGEATQLILGETDQLQPGDVLKVGLEVSNLTQGSSVAPALVPQSSNIPNVQTR